jgi:hypothetical protein
MCSTTDGTRRLWRDLRWLNSDILNDEMEMGQFGKHARHITEPQSWQILEEGVPIVHPMCALDGMRGCGMAGGEGIVAAWLGYHGIQQGWKRVTGLSLCGEEARERE